MHYLIMPNTLGILTFQLNNNINMTEPTSPEPRILDEETIINDPSKSSLPPLLQDQPKA